MVEGVLPQWTERGKDAYEFGKHCIRAGKILKDERRCEIDR